MFKKWLICTFLIIYSFAFGYSEQVVVSQFATGLAESTTKNTYSLTGVTNSDSIRAVNSTDLANVIDLTSGIVTGTFTGDASNLKFIYNTAEKSIAIPVKRNEEATVSTGKFQLTETSSTSSGEDVTNYLIKDTIKLPAKAITLSQASSTTGIKFIYDEGTAKAAHLSAYKKQEFIIRIAKSLATTNYDVIEQTNGIKLATDNTNTKDFMEGANYVDFLVTGDLYDEEQSISTSEGLSLKFMPENIEIFGLPKGSYRIEVYSFRYSQVITSVPGNVVITKEDSKEFSVGNTEFLEEGIDIMNFSSSSVDFKIKATILTINSSAITSGAIAVKEDAITYGGAMITATSGAIYTDTTTSGAIAIDDDGTASGGKYYQLWEVEYTTTNKTINTNTRTVTYTMGSKSASTTYNLISSTADYTSKPLYQTVFATFAEKTYGNGTYEIDDRAMNKYSDGYRNIRKLDTSSGIEALYKGINGGETMSLSSYNWTGTAGRNSLIISKAISDSKGTFQEIGNASNTFTFYTTEWQPNLRYVNESEKTNQDDMITLTWDSPEKSSYSTTLNEEKIIFRIIKSTGDINDTEKYRYKPEINENPILESTSDRLSNFMNGTINYFDIIFKSGENSKQTYDNVVFDFSKNNILKISGLDAGNYKMQTYSLQNEDTVASSDDSYDYRVLTYGGPLKIKNSEGEYEEEDDFSMMEPVVPSLSYTIDSIDYNKDTKKVEIGLLINADQLVSLTKDNLIAKKAEELTDSKYYFSSPSALVAEAWNPSYSKATSSEIYGNVKAVDPDVISVSKSEREDFQYPLDIIFLIDNSASMQNEIDAVKDGLDNFSKSLTARGYDVKFNLITFGANQTTTQTSYNDGVIGSPINKSYSEYSDIDFSKYSYLAIFNKSQKWFSSTTKLKDALANLQGIGGATGGQENGSYAIHYGIEQLKANGRYLNKSFDIVSANSPVSERYKPSKKWLILLTDENMDIENVPSGYSKSSAIVKQFTKQLEDSNINLTGIYHTSFVSSSNEVTTYDSLGSDISQKTFWIFRNTYFEVNTDSKGHYILYNRKGNKQYFRNSSGNLISPSTNLNISTTYKIKDETNSDIIPIYNGDNQLRDIKYYGQRYIYDFFNGAGSRPQDFGDVFYTDFALASNWDNVNKKVLFNMYDMGVDGELVEGALIDSVKDIGIIQRWIVKYTSPYGDDSIKSNDGQPREALFSLNNVKSYKSTTESAVYLDLKPYDISGGTSTTSGGTILGNRNYTVPMQKIKVECLNPNKKDPGDDNTRKLIKKDGKINLKGRAQSQYKTEIDKVMQWVNYPIIKGTFIITGNYSDDGDTVGTPVSKIVTSADVGTEKVMIENKEEDGSTWYYAESNINAKEFTATFGKNPVNVEVKFIAETAELSDKDTVTGVTVVEKDQPKVTSLTMTNITLSDFMDDLKKTDGTSTFDSDSISKATVKTKSNAEGLTADDLNVTTTSSGMELNVKAGDKVKLEFEIDDESITAISTGVKVAYNGVTYTATYVGATANTTKTNWKVELDSFVYKNGVDNISFNITDDSKSPNITVITADTFNQPELLANTTLIPSSNTERYSDEYYDNGTINVVEVEDALAYLVVFDYDSTIVDDGARTGTYPGGTKKWISYSSSEFNFFEGKHSYDKTVYVMNSAGAIKTITHDDTKNAKINTGSIDNVIAKINIGSTNFYVDEQSPSITNFDFRKDSDPNLSDSSLLNNNSIASGILIGTISSDRLYKAGDGVSVNFNLKEVNFFKTVLSQVSGVDIISNPIVTIAGNTVAVNTTTGLEGTTAAIDNKAYKKSGIAVDLTSGDSATSPNMSLTVYDRAGNKVTQTFISYYDDTVPNQISVVSQKTGTNGSSTYKYTRDVSIPLTKTGNNYSVGLMSRGGSYVGDLTATSSSINLVSFKTNGSVVYSPVLNNYNLLDLTSFSKSGKKGVLNSDAIVLDTEINDARNSITETIYTYNSGSYIVDLTNTLKTIGELVGLESYSISSSSNGARLQHGSTTDNISAVNTLVDLDTQSLYRNTIGTTPYTSINNIILVSSGNTKFKLTLKDRLNNTKEIDYIVQIPNNVNIIGKTVKSNKTISTKIDNSTKVIKIKSRTE